MKVGQDRTRACWRGVALALAVLCPSSGALAQDSWTPEQREVLAAMEELSDSTAPNGTGADAYGAVLAEGFSRWTIGSAVMNDKHDWVEGVREWFDEGWRVADRQTQHLEILIRGDLAFTRRMVEETYLGPAGEQSKSGAALAEVWVRSDLGWRLLRVDVHPLADT